MKIDVGDNRGNFLGLIGQRGMLQNDNDASTDKRTGHDGNGDLPMKKTLIEVGEKNHNGKNDGDKRVSIHGLSLHIKSG